MPPSPRVLVSLLDDAQENQRHQAATARSAGQRAGLEVEVLYAKSNPVLQLQQIFRAITGPEAARPTAIVAETGSASGFEGAARAALQAGIGWVLVSDSAPYLETLRREHPGRLIASAAVDDAEVGRIQARLIRTLLPQGGSVLTVEGPPESAATLHRRKGLEEGLKGSTCQVVKALTADWGTEGATQAVSLWLRLAARGRRPDLVCAQNDLMGAGARRGLEAVKPQWADLPIIGCDGLAEGGQRLVRERVLTATVVTGSTAAPGVELVARALRGEAVPPQTVITPRPYPALDELSRRAVLAGTGRS
jgi:ABC-type sugar transport system substrate-binding protein